MRQAKIDRIKKKWVEKIEEGHKISVKWDAGYDETPVWVYSDEVEENWKECEGLVTLVIEKLNLPNAGELNVKGGGEILVKNHQLVITHHSKHEGIDYVEPEEDADLESYDWAGSAFEVDKLVSGSTLLIP